MVWLARWFNWQQALTVVQPETFRRWRRQRWWWHGPSCPGRPPIPVELQALIRQMAHENLTCGQRRIANELWLKLGLQVSPRTVRKCLPAHRDRAPGQRATSQRWRTFVHNHAWDLIVRGMAVGCIRGVHAPTVRLIQFLQRWWCHAVATGVQGASQGYAGAIPLLRVTISVPIAWTADTGAVIRVDQRSPPDGGLPCTHDRGLASTSPSQLALERFGPDRRGVDLGKHGVGRMVEHRFDTGCVLAVKVLEQDARLGRHTERVSAIGHASLVRTTPRINQVAPSAQGHLRHALRGLRTRPS